jgi:hypothetical protein
METGIGYLALALAMLTCAVAVTQAYNVKAQARVARDQEAARGRVTVQMLSGGSTTFASGLRCHCSSRWCRAYHRRRKP